MIVFTYNKVKSNFKGRLKTQDRGSKLPMRAIMKFYSGNNSMSDLLDRTVDNVRFLTSKDGKEYTTLKQINCIEIDENNLQVFVIKKSGEKKLVYTEIYSRVTEGGVFEPLKAESKSLESLTLDHDVPISCLLKIKDVGGEYINKMNHLYYEFVVKHKELKKDSQKAKEFFDHFKDETIIDKVFKDHLLNEIIKVFDLGSITIMDSIYNTSKNNSFQYCDGMMSCSRSKIKKLIDSYNKQ